MDLQRIRAYIDEFSGNERDSDVDTKYLLREWRAQKKPLFKLLGITEEEYNNEDVFWSLPDERFILQQDIEYAASEDKLVKAFKDAFNGDIEILVSFREKYFNFINSDEFKKTLTDLGGNTSLTSLWALERLARLKCLYYGEYNHEEFKYPYMKNGKQYTLTLSKGSKTTRMLRKVVEAYKPDLLPECDEFLTKLSLLKNQKTIKGTLCVSAHPLDFMTASDNEESWSSCMNWMNDGCYRRGTVELMDSSKVFCVYLKSGARHITFNGYEWNSKKWRSWIVYAPEDGIMTTVKGYPYQNEKLDGAVLDVVAQLGDVLWSEKTSEFHGRCMTTEDDREYEFETNVMYNDFGNSNTSHYKLTGNFAGHCFTINFSGQAVCMNCGALEPEDDVFSSDTAALVCDDCRHVERCANCNCVINEHRDHFVDGEWLCEDCYADLVDYDTITEDEHLMENMYDVYLINDVDHAPEDMIEVGDVARVYSLSSLDSPVYNGARFRYCLWSEVKENNEEYAFQ